MREVEVYEPLGNWMAQKFGFEWYEITHENPCIIINENEERAEVDLCFGRKKGKQFEVTDAVHVKTRDNLVALTNKYELVGKSLLTLEGVERVWLALEQSTLPSIKGIIDEKIGVITYTETNGVATSFSVKKEPQRKDKPRFYNDTQNLFNEKFGDEIKTSHNVFICSMNKDNWNICRIHKLWGVPKGATAAESAIKRTKPGDIILFRLNKVGFVGIWMITSDPFEDPIGGPWKNENPKETRDFVWQVKMHPMLVEEFSKPVELEYPKGINKETSITTKLFMSGMAGITDKQYKIISKKLIDVNLTQLQ